MRIDRSRGMPVLALLAVLVLALFAAACGDDDDEGGGGTKGKGIRAGEGDRTEKARAAGTAAGKELGPAKLEAKTVGIINILGGIESADRLQATMEEAAKNLGFKSVPCDGQGDPRKMLACGDSLLDRDVDAIVTIAVDTSLIKPVIAKAKKKGVPILQNAGESGEGYDASFFPSEEEKAAVLSDAIIEKLNTEVKDKPAEVITQDYPAPWAKDRTDVFKEKLKSEPDIKLVADTNTDATQLLEYTKKTVADQLTQHPDVDAFWFSFDATGQAGGPVIAQKYPGKKFPDRPLIATFHADLGTQALMRKDQVDLLVDSNYDAAVWMAYDALAQFWARDTPFITEPQPEYPGVGNLFFFKTIEKKDLPPEGEYVETPVDVPAYFQAKWEAEFGGAAG